MKKRPKHFKPSAAAENEFMRALRKVGRHAGHIIEMHVGGIGTPQGLRSLLDATAKYSELIDPWARVQSAKMLDQVAKANRRSYNAKAKQIGLRLKLDIRNSEVGQVAAALMAEQVALIKSIPLRAGERAQKLAQEAFLSGGRASAVAAELLDSTDVSEAQAATIARTEVARSNASFTQARAIKVGATGYIWRTTMDGAERDSHRKMNGKFVEYAKPPRLTDGTQGHAGTFPNCRCYQDVQFDDGQ